MCYVLIQKVTQQNVFIIINKKFFVKSPFFIVTDYNTITYKNH